MVEDHSVQHSLMDEPTAKETSAAYSQGDPSELHNLNPNSHSYNMLDLLHNNQSLIDNVRYLGMDRPDREQRLVEKWAKA